MQFCVQHWILLTIIGEVMSVSKNEVYHWGTWSSLPLTCSVTCGRGLRCRVRKCLDGYGNVQKSSERCSNPEDYESKSESCTICVVHSTCPEQPGWSSWGEWSACMPRENITTSEIVCQKGIRVRYRSCTNPPPEPPPFGIQCQGPSSETGECQYNCEEEFFGLTNLIAKQITLQVEMDHLNGLRHFEIVKRKQVGDFARLSCDTPAYRLAARLLVSKKFSALKKGLGSNQLRVVWFKNGKPVQEIQKRALYEKLGKANKDTSISENNELYNEELHWNTLLPVSSAYMEGTDLVFLSLQEGDMGFYTCRLELGEYRWTAIFYSLIIPGVTYRTQTADPFFLHSNLGYYSGLHFSPAWLEAARLVWTINGLEYSRGIAERLSMRIYSIANINLTHQGTWMCYLLLPPPDRMSILSSSKIRVSGKYLINEFLLRVKLSQTSIWQAAQHSSSLTTLRNIAAIQALLCLVLLLFLILNIWSVRRWITRSLSVDQKKAIIQEMLDNQCRLMLTARKRAIMNKERILPLILQEHQRLERAELHLHSRLKETRLFDEEQVGMEDGDSGAPKLSLPERFHQSVLKLSRLMKQLSSAFARKPTRPRSMSRFLHQLEEDKFLEGEHLEPVYRGSLMKHRESETSVRSLSIRHNRKSSVLRRRSTMTEQREFNAGLLDDEAILSGNEIYRRRRSTKTRLSDHSVQDERNDEHLEDRDEEEDEEDES